MPNTQAQKQAIKRYIKRKYEFFQITFLKGKREYYKVLAEWKNESLNQYIIQAIENRIASDFSEAELKEAELLAIQRIKEKEEQKNNDNNI